MYVRLPTKKNILINALYIHTHTHSHSRYIYYTECSMTSPSPTHSHTCTCTTCSHILECMQHCQHQLLYCLYTHLACCKNKCTIPVASCNIHRHRQTDTQTHTQTQTQTQTHTDTDTDTHTHTHTHTCCLTDQSQSLGQPVVINCHYKIFIIFK